MFAQKHLILFQRLFHSFTLRQKTNRKSAANVWYIAWKMVERLTDYQNSFRNYFWFFDLMIVWLINQPTVALSSACTAEQILILHFELHVCFMSLLIWELFHECDSMNFCVALYVKQPCFKGQRYPLWLPPSIFCFCLFFIVTFTVKQIYTQKRDKDAHTCLYADPPSSFLFPSASVQKIKAALHLFIL